MGKWLQKFQDESTTVSTLSVHTIPPIQGNNDNDCLSAIENGATRPTDTFDSVRVSTLSVRDMASHTDDFAERAAIIEHEAGIPREWAEAFARVCTMPKPDRFSRNGWQRLIDNTGRMLDQPAVLQSLVRHGWTAADIFAVHPKAPEARQDCKGLLLLLREAEQITQITEQAIALQCTGSVATTYYRRPLAPSTERSMLWEMK